MGEEAIRSYDPFAPEVIEFPYPYYAWLRREAPVYYNEERGIWAISRHSDVVAAARNPGIFSSAQGVGPQREPLKDVLSQDPPNHTRLRTLVNRAFTSRVIAALAPRIQRIVDHLLDNVIRRNHLELVSDIASPLPVTVIAELLGVEVERQNDIKRWSDEFLYFVSQSLEQRDVGRFQATWFQFCEYFTQMIHARRQHPRDDLMTLLVSAREGGDCLSEAEILAFCKLLLVAGHETTTNLITNLWLALFTYPDIGRHVQDDPQTIPTVIEEALRFDSPVQLFFRTTTQAFEMHDRVIPANSKVALIWGSANRDESVFANPQKFDPRRSPNQHLAFGYGIHFCIGAPLARLEVKILTETIIRRFRKLRTVASEPPQRLQNTMLRGLTKFPLMFEPY